MKCTLCLKQITKEKNHYGVHPHCFMTTFQTQDLTEFTSFSRKDIKGDRASGDPPYLTSFFIGNYRKYEAALGEDLYILKFQEKNFPELVSVEYFCNRVFEKLKLPIPKPMGVVTMMGEPCFIVKNFLDVKASQGNLVHIYHFLKPGADHYTVKNVLEAILEKTLNVNDGEVFLTMLLADALIGNHDRHGRNLGIIETPTYRRLAPIYDNVSALGLESGPMLLADWEPKGKIATRHTNEPTMKDYVREICELGYSYIVDKFKHDTHQLQLKYVFDHTLSDTMRKALDTLIKKRMHELEEAIKNTKT